MAATIVQSAEGTSTSATVTASFAVAPTNGNVIVLAFASDDYNGTPNTGWTQSTGMEQQTFHGAYLWHKVASGGSNSFQYTIGSATNSSWILLEISGLDASYYDISSGQFAQSSGNSYSTPTLTPTSGERFLIAYMGASHSSGNFSADLTTWSNSFTHIRSSGPASASGTRDVVCLASLSVTANGSTGYSTTGTYPAGWPTPTSRSGLIISFKVASGSSPQTITGSLYSDSDSFQTATVSSNYSISGNLYTDADTFFVSTIVVTYNINANVFNDADTFFASTTAPGTANIAANLFSDGDSFSTASVVSNYSITGTRFDDSDSFQAATIEAFYNINTSVYSDVDNFFAANVIGTQIINGNLYSDDDTFLSSIMTQQQFINANTFTDPDLFFVANIDDGVAPTTQGGLFVTQRRRRR